MKNLIISLTIPILIIPAVCAYAETRNPVDINTIKQDFIENNETGMFKSGGVSILLVSDQSDGVDQPEYYDSSYIDAVEAGNYSYGVWEHDILGSPTFEDIEDYDIIIWFTGKSGEYSADHPIFGHVTITPEEESILYKYLMETDGDRLLVLSGMWIAWNCVADASSEEQIYSPLFTDLFGLDYVDDNFTNWILVEDDWSLIGVGGAPFFSNGYYNIDWLSTGNFPDQLESMYDGETAIWCEPGDIYHHYGIIYNSVVKANGTARTILMSSPLESIDNSEDRERLIEEICNWAGVYPVSIQTMSYGSIKKIFSEY